jgi:hypothetical protein
MSLALNTSKFSLNNSLPISYGTFSSENDLDSKVQEIKKNAFNLMTLVNSCERYSLAIKVLNFIPVIGWLINLFIYMKMDSLQTQIMLQCGPLSEQCVEIMKNEELDDAQRKTFLEIHNILVHGQADLTISRLSLILGISHSK